MYIYKSKDCPCTVPLSEGDFYFRKQLYYTKRTAVYSIATVEMQMHHELVLKRYSKKRLGHSGYLEALREIRIHSSLAHPHILHLYAAWESKRSVYLLLEYAECGDLFDLIYKKGSYEEAFVVSMIMEPMLQAVKYLHELDVIHNDIKPENIGFRKNGELVLMDFGLAVCYSDFLDPVHKLNCTKDYAAPEMTSSCKVCDPKAIDIWCIGLLLYEVVTRSSPKRVIDGACRMHRNVANKTIRDLFKLCTRQDPTMRPSITQVCDTMQWLSGHLAPSETGC